MENADNAQKKVLFFISFSIACLVIIILKATIPILPVPLGMILILIPFWMIMYIKAMYVMKNFYNDNHKTKIE